MLVRLCMIAVLLAIPVIGCRRNAPPPPLQSPPPQPSAGASQPLPPDPQRILHALSPLSPENTLAQLPRVDGLPVDQRTLITAPIETWSQTGVANGYLRMLEYDAVSQRFWIRETGGIVGRVHWYGPLVLDDHNVIRVAGDPE